MINEEEENPCDHDVAAEENILSSPEDQIVERLIAGTVFVALFVVESE